MHPIRIPHKVPMEQVPSMIAYAKAASPTTKSQSSTNIFPDSTQGTQERPPIKNRHDILAILHNDFLPEWVAEFLPEEIIHLNDNKHMVRHCPISETMSNLPKNGDKFDTTKIRTGLKTAVKYIKSKNKEAKALFNNYGVYREQINNFNVANLIVGPELAFVIDQKFGLNLNIGKGPVNLCADLLDDTNYVIQNAQDITERIDKQDKELDELLEMPLDTPEDIEKVMVRYQKITGTAFSYDGIMETDKALQDGSNVGKKKQMELVCQNYGLMNNLTDAYKNKVATDILYTTFRDVSSFVMNKIPVTHIASYFVPYGMEATEVLTQGHKPGEVFNDDQFTADNFIHIAETGTAVNLQNHLLGPATRGVGFFARLGMNTAIKSGRKATNAVITTNPQNIATKAINSAVNPLYQAKVLWNWLTE